MLVRVSLGHGEFEEFTLSDANAGLLQKMAPVADSLIQITDNKGVCRLFHWRHVRSVKMTSVADGT